MTDPTPQIRNMIGRLLPDAALTVTPMSETIRRASERPPRRSWPKVVAVSVATAVLLLAGGVFWQVDSVADRNARQEVVVASVGSGVADDLAARCPVEEGGGRLINALRWPGGRAVLTANDTRFSLCLGGETGPLSRNGWGEFSPGKTSLVCGQVSPTSCEGGAQHLPGPLRLSSWVLAYGATVPGTTRVRAYADGGHQVEVSAQNGTFLLRVESVGSKDIGIHRVEMFGATGEKLLTWDWDRP
ncbi:hypothetical protein ABZ570_15770 [Micromonospora sp. NPDC007271]|uniref:hypothetical protein n=1 Tax=Micromonospora sp. NPDC007271 TaxID=3154587 RepID=UPI0033C71DB3